MPHESLSEPRARRPGRSCTTRAAAAATIMLLFPFSGCAQEALEEPDPAIQRYAELARDRFSGDRALETVASMEGTFRLPGNAGFDSAVARVRRILESAGFADEAGAAPGHPLTYRIERRSLSRPTWEPVEGELQILEDAGFGPLLQLSKNLNMIAINSYSTPVSGIEAEVVYVGAGRPGDFEGKDVEGKIVFGEASVRRLFTAGVQERGALGVLSYSMPDYTRPQENPSSIQFSSIPLDPDRKSWGLRLSYGAKERLKDALDSGSTVVRVRIVTRIYPSEELTLIADVHGNRRPEERLVLSAHVQEPGANDNASGVAVQAEVARVLGTSVLDESFSPGRTISMVWGDEISSTRRYVEEDPGRASGILWGLSLDMVGEDTEKTGGSFLIEKMPDPSTTWPRGRDRHTEWWGDRASSMTEDDLTPHYLNDFVLHRCQDQAAVTGWEVRTNPFEGGSDHVPFLRGGIPGLLLWHFTDQFYHTDGDRLDKVSPRTMANVGACTLAVVMTLTSAEGGTARSIIRELEVAAMDRISSEFELSRAAVAEGEDRLEQIRILRAWIDWYAAALETTLDIEIGGSGQQTRGEAARAADRVRKAGAELLDRLQT